MCTLFTTGREGEKEKLFYRSPTQKKKIKCITSSVVSSMSGKSLIPLVFPLIIFPFPKSSSLEWAAPAPHMNAKERRNFAIKQTKAYIEGIDLEEADYGLLEFCCDRHSRLCDQKYSKTPSGGKCVLVRFTEDHDMTSQEGFEFAQWVVAKLSKLPMILWGAIPCTAGCSWHRVNRSRARKGELPNFLQKHRDIWRDFRVLFKNFVDLSKLVHNTCKHNEVAFEWPQFNDLWKNTNVRKWLDGAGLQEVCFNGCMVGVISKRGRPILKPWKVVTDSDEIVQTFLGKKAVKDKNGKCSCGVKKHDQARGGYQRNWLLPHTNV